MSSTSIERGDIVRIKPEWLEMGENGEQKYVVLQDYGNNRVLIRALDTGLPLPPVNMVDINSLLYCGRAYPKYEPEQIPSGMNVYIEASFTVKSTGEHKTIEVKIDEDLIPWGVHKFLTARYGENLRAELPLHQRGRGLILIRMNTLYKYSNNFLVCTN